MCRIYPCKTGRYVRLCYRHGIMQGTHVPVAENFTRTGCLTKAEVRTLLPKRPLPTFRTGPDPRQPGDR